MASASSTPPNQDNQVAAGDYLTSTNSQYLVESFLGEGTFGKVAKCKRMCDMKTVAIKIMKNEDSHAMAAKIEVAALTALKVLDSDKCNLVQWCQVFKDRGHTCLEFEHLDKSLFDYMKEKMFRPLSLREIRPIIQQVTNALDHLRTVGIIHADLKLENVMLVNQLEEPFKVKVIDFGLARKVSHARVGSYIQTRPFRSPEVILGCPYTEAIDMWSLGCMAAFMYLGTLLYPGYSQYDMMRFIVGTQGQPPDHMLNAGRNTHLFFQRDNDSTTSLWKLKSPEQIHKETGIQPVDTRRFKFNSLDSLLHMRRITGQNSVDNAAQKNDVAMFVDMLKGMLVLDAAKRVTPRQVLQHQFISMSHLASMYHLSKNVRECFDRMKVCQKVTLQQTPPEKSKVVDSHAAPAHCSSSSSQAGTALTSQPGMHDSYKRSGDDRKRFRRSPAGPSTSSCRSQNQNCVSPSTKRRRADGEDERREEATYCPHQRPDEHTKRFKQSPAGPSTSSCRSQNQICVSPSAKSKRADGEDARREEATYRPYERPDGHTKRFKQSPAGPSTSSCRSQNQFCVSPSTKRKRADGEDERHEEATYLPLQRPDEYTKRFKQSPAGPSTSSCRSQNQICVSPSTKRKRADGEDERHEEATYRPLQRLDEYTKRFKQSPAGPSTSSCRSQNQICVSPSAKRKRADGEDERHEEATYRPLQRPDEHTKRFKQSPAGPSTSSCRSQNQICVTPRAKRKRADEGEDSAQERKEDRKCDASTSAHSSSDATSHTHHVQQDQRSSHVENHSYCSRTSGWTWTKRQPQPGPERKAADDEHMQHRKRKSDDWSDGDGDEFRSRKDKSPRVQ